MPDPQDLYQLVDDPPELGRPVLIQALTGFVDAGAAGRLAREHLLTSLSGRIVATFDIDALLDYRSRRPVMLFVEDHWESYEEPSLALHLLYDGSNTPFLLLSGPEPDLHWERFTAAVIGLIDRLGVRLTVGFNSIPMAVPHTRPTGVTAHATRRDLIAGYEPWLRRVQVPGAAGHLLEYRLGQAGRDAIGLRRARAALPGAERVPGGGRAAADRGLQGHRPACCRPRTCAAPPSWPEPRSTSRSPRPRRRRPSCSRWSSSTTRSSGVRSGASLLGRLERPAADGRRTGRRAGTVPGRADPPGRPTQPVDPPKSSRTRIPRPRSHF